MTLVGWIYVYLVTGAALFFIHLFLGAGRKKSTTKSEPEIEQVIASLKLRVIDLEDFYERSQKRESNRIGRSKREEIQLEAQQQNLIPITRAEKRADLAKRVAIFKNRGI